MSITEAEVAKSITDLIKNEGAQNKANEVFGMLFPYAGIKQKAIDIYIKEIEKSNLPIETKVLMVLNTKKDFKRIKNQKAVVEKAFSIAKEGTDFSSDSGVNEDWLDRFLESAGYVSSDDIQIIWAKILAGEFEHPGSTPPNMIRVLSEFTPDLAKAFRKICSMTVLLIPLNNNGETEDAFETILVPYKQNGDEFNNLGLGFTVLNELETLGVIKFDSFAGYVSKGISNTRILLCVENRLELIEEYPKEMFPTGNVLLTSVGEALKSITDKVEISNYRELVNSFLIRNRVKFAEKHDYIAEVKDNKMTINRRK